MFSACALSKSIFIMLQSFKYNSPSPFAVNEPINIPKIENNTGKINFQSAIKPFILTLYLCKLTGFLNLIFSKLIPPVQLNLCRQAKKNTAMINLIAVNYYSLFCSEYSVSGIAKTRNNVAMIIKLFILSCKENINVRMCFFQGS